MSMESLAEEWLRFDKVRRKLHNSTNRLVAYIMEDPVTRSEIERLIGDNNLDELQTRLGNSKQNGITCSA